MKDYLIFRLYGPMVSWGDIAVGPYRPSFDHPSKSAIFGLLGAALGIRRDEEEKQLELASAYHYGVLINSSGVMLRDYHTSQVPASGKGRNKKKFLTRKDELAVPKYELNTILSTRDYYCDGLYTVILSSTIDNPPYSLETIGNSLKKPSFSMYLGRKSCPLSLPLDPIIVSGSNMKEALTNAEFKDEAFVRKLINDGVCRFYWDNPEEDIAFEHSVSRRDNILSRKRWQFSDRKEYYSMLDWRKDTCI
ncbi:type I-E CRISPR-associated protein Cas5/CasD [Methanolobus bombayensis]|uniref:type I-E CRISPR-associated protein Cas5/CasD n=1 Tax=Methanolobus bombayensis TaxID=38023 RepID=UPI001AE61C1B|nr:CRISPR system Cascade subunit CasD [Methanolobus bombayensis]